MNCPSCGAPNANAKICSACGTLVGRGADDDYIGSIVAKKYRVEQLIGEGGMGRVYRATQLALDKPVVLKVLRRSLLSDERTVARFQREAKAASRLNHPNSISVLDFGQAEDGLLFIAMEYVAGKDLHQIISYEWPLPEARVVNIGAQVLSALSDAHRAGVIHRDLKPENIMVEQRREGDFVKVLDFGIAKITDAAGEVGPALTRAGFVCGTPEYMSPEQARGAPLDHRSDLYAVGVLLYQVITGLLPFEADSAVGFATKHLTDEPPAPSRRRPEAKISHAMERLILRALSKDPDRRPQTADAFRQELFAVLERRPAGSGGTHKPSREEVTDKRSAPRPAWTDEKTVRVDPPLSPGGKAKRPAPRAASRQKKTRAAPGLWVAAVAALAVLGAGLGGIYLRQRYLRQSAQRLEQAAETPKPEAPIQITALPQSTVPPYEADFPAGLRDPQKARRLVEEGDLAWERGRSQEALAKYREAFENDPIPELSLKLGELCLQSDQLEQSKGWWARHLRDKRDSKAASYIRAVFPDLP